MPGDEGLHHLRQWVTWVCQCGRKFCELGHQILQNWPRFSMIRKARVCRVPYHE